MSGIKNIIILYSDLDGNERLISKFVHINNGNWVYFGKNYINFKKIESFFGSKFEYIEISELLDKVSGLYRDDYNMYIDQLNRLNKDKFEWWFTPLSSRNIYLNDVFQNICYWNVIEEVIQRCVDDFLLVIVESYSTGMLVEKWADAHNIPFKSISKPHRGRIYSLIQALLSIVKTGVKVSFNYVFAAVSKIGLKGKNDKKSDPKGKMAIIDLFVYESNFGLNGLFNNRFFPGLSQFLVENGYNVLYHPTLTETNLDKYRLYRKIRENKEFFIIDEDYLGFLDYIRSFVLSIKAISFRENYPDFKDVDISSLYNCENKWLFFDGIYKSFLVYHTFLRLGSKIGNKIERVICWHENQLQDKALCYAVHNVFPETKIVGVQHFLHYSNYLSLYPLDSEAEALFLPDVILTSGTLESEKLRKHLNEVPVFESAALRYSYLFDKKDVDVVSPKRDIIILLPYDRNDAFELAMRVGEIIGEISETINFVFKCHPDYSSEIFESIFKGEILSDRIYFTDDKLDRLLASAAMFISTASSSVIETAVSGVPTIMLSKYNALSLNPLDSIDCPVVSVCYNSYSLKKQIYIYLELSLEQREDLIKTGELLKTKFFTMTNEKNMKIFGD